MAANPKLGQAAPLNHSTPCHGGQGQRAPSRVGRVNPEEYPQNDAFTVSNAAPTHSTCHTGGMLISTEGRVLPLLSRRHRPSGAALSEWVRCAAHGDLFVPAAGGWVVSGFAFRIGARRVVGEIDRLEAARERFEGAILEGQSGALLEQNRSSLFCRRLGNIPPGAEVVAEPLARTRWPAWVGQPSRLSRPNAEEVGVGPNWEDCRSGSEGPRRRADPVVEASRCRAGHG